MQEATAEMARREAHTAETLSHPRSELQYHPRQAEGHAEESRQYPEESRQHLQKSQSEITRFKNPHEEDRDASTRLKPEFVWIQNHHRSDRIIHDARTKTNTMRSECAKTKSRPLRGAIKNHKRNKESRIHRLSL